MNDAGTPGLLSDRNLLVVGASSGIGRAICVAAAAEGASVVAAARRYDHLRTLAEEVGPRLVPVQCDVRSPISCDLAVSTAVQQLGGLDTVVFATGIKHLQFLEHTDRDAWMDVLETNLVGAALITRAALPRLRDGSQRSAPRPRVAYLSSHAVGRPWPGLGAYLASKAALDEAVRAWRAECPDVSFGRVVVGPSLSGMADAWDPELATAMFELWQDGGYVDDRPPVEPDVVARSVVGWIAADEPPDDVVLAAL